MYLVLWDCGRLGGRFCEDGTSRRWPGASLESAHASGIFPSRTGHESAVGISDGPVLADQAPGQPQGIDELAAEREALAARLIERHFDAHIRPGEGATGQR